ncbi:tRNA (adenosine(37)-N6)-threonylcarbamoyltransferase complex dimerization subunit type 1 TsaB [Candidatus Cyrtobacter comes]|uniref:tRNA (adenosine(37)-N6)-threonylcarbamoyltransferase complex dimerization subunit type 1 TsaB n=1 Tax=Candidatus Cyrtobacter comes TaxID=675776 RepID=UPI002ACE94A9|nr:tRNA (adenosine(37)-N6)-threonylcarbamoyltransferase complex dimerization subunit type 1 TsaB [Candidatus Cyrtobacter comes]
MKCGDSFFFRILSQENQHASNLNILIDEVLNEAKISYSDLSIVVVTVGPGSFTGIRVGMSAAYAINAVYDTAIYGISTLEIFAYIKECNSIVSSEAGRDRFYIQHFSSDKVPSSPIQLFHKDELNNYNSSIAGAYIGESYNAHDILKAFHYKLKNFPVVTQLPSPIYINNAIY